VAGREPVLAEVVARDPRVDVALLKAPLTGLVPLAAGSTRDLAPGMWVLACGSPYGLERSWSAGIVSGLHRRGVAAQPSTYEDFIQADAAANLGNSGGPLLDPNGRVLGMVTQILTRAGGWQGISLATPVEAVLEAVRRLRGGTAGAPEAARASLGITVRERADGLEVAAVAPGSAAEQAGLRAGARLLEVAGQPVASAADVERALWGRRPGETVEMSWLAAGPRDPRTPAVRLRGSGVLR
jgi:serine protease Do